MSARRQVIGRNCEYLADCFDQSFTRDVAVILFRVVLHIERVILLQESTE